MGIVLISPEGLRLAARRMIWSGLEALTARPQREYSGGRYVDSGASRTARAWFLNPDAGGITLRACAEVLDMHVGRVTKRAARIIDGRDRILADLNAGAISMRRARLALRALVPEMVNRLDDGEGWVNAYPKATGPS